MTKPSQRKILDMTWREAIPTAFFLCFVILPLGVIGKFIAGTAFGVLMTIHVYDVIDATRGRKR